jgi:hypothetical protein
VSPAQAEPRWFSEAALWFILGSLTYASRRRALRKRWRLAGFRIEEQAWDELRL